jgi:sporulation protein YlmC with PRC-barrel domain
MRGTFAVMLVVCGACLAAVIGLQAVLGEPTDTIPPSQGTMQQQMTSGDSHFVQASRVLGLEVRNENQETLGKIQDLAIDLNTGKVRYAVLSVGGVMGMGGKLMPMPWNALQAMTKPATTEGAMPEVYCILNISKDALQKAPSFESSRQPDFNNQKWVVMIEDFYRPYIAQQHRGATTR